jgi:hypothetical protein
LPRARHCLPRRCPALAGRKPPAPGAHRGQGGASPDG